MDRNFPRALAPTSVVGRIEAIDALRGLALFGVLLVNLVTEFRVSIFQQFETRHTDAGSLNYLVDDALALFVSSRAFALFSLLFGVGLGIQFERVTATGRHFVSFALRRMGGLLALGLVHLCFVWNGDILTWYALAGLTVIPLVHTSRRTLLAVSLAALVVYALPLPYPALFRANESLAQHVVDATRVYGSGTFGAIADFRLRELRHIAPLDLTAMPRTIALFALGIVLWRVRAFDPPPRAWAPLGRYAVIFLILGLGASVVVFGVGEKWWTLPESIVGACDGLGGVALSLGYAASFVWLARRPGFKRVVALFAPLGRAALTNYLLQSVLLGFLFYGYGLGLMGHVGPAAAAGLAVIVYAVQLVASTYWFRHFQFGPVEWLWRWVSYGRRPRWASTLP